MALTALRRTQQSLRFVQNVRRGYYELAADIPANRRVAVALDELAMAI
jgi:hypothetical protein